jgi:hypothetical protein
MNEVKNEINFIKNNQGRYFIHQLRDHFFLIGFTLLEFYIASCETYVTC